MTETEIESPLMDAREVANYLRVTTDTLAQWRTRGKGPKYHRMSNRFIRYKRDDVVAFGNGEAA